MLSSGHAQTIELLYIPSDISNALSLKKGLKADKINATNALSLSKISVEREETYLKSLSSSDVVIILGETTLKAVAEIDFTIPVIIINATGKASAKGPVHNIMATKDKDSLLDALNDLIGQIVSKGK